MGYIGLTSKARIHYFCLLDRPPWKLDTYSMQTHPHRPRFRPVPNSSTQTLLQPWPDPPTFVRPAIAAARLPPDEPTIEIEGEATVLAPAPAASPTPGTTLAPIADRLDDLIVAGLDQRQLTVAPGESVAVRVALLNQGELHARFVVQVEGWVDEQWITITRGDETSSPEAALWLHPDERAMVTVNIAPPRTVASTAGDHPFAVVIRAEQYSDHVSRLGATLTILPYFDLALGPAQPSTPQVSWRKRTTNLRLPVTNLSNTEATLFVQGHDAQRRCQITFRDPDPAKPSHPRRITLRLAAGETHHLVVHIRPPRPPVLSVRPRPLSIRLAAGISKGQQTPLAAFVTLHRRPLIGVWPLLGLLSLLAVGVSGAILLTALVATMFSQVASRPTPQPQPLPAAQPQPITIIVNLAQPAPTSGAPVQLPPISEQPLAPIVTEIGPAPAQAGDSSAPIVRPDQVTAPGAPLPAAAANRIGAAGGPAPLLPVENPNAIEQPPAELTYQQMFELIATHYDLNWRVLAAQAYIESSFDPLALGNGGAMGLLQIMPATWQEWAPQASVSDPFDAYSNTLVAALYLDFLRSELGQRGYGEIEWMLVAYNWGIDQLNEHLAAGQSWDALPAVVRQYAEDVLRIAETLQS